MSNEKEDVKARVLKNGVIVAGHPRSGTSLVCQLLESAGVEFPSDFEGDEYNRAGYYELEKSKKLSRNLLKEAMTIENTKDMNQIVERLNSCDGPGGLKLVRIGALFFYRHIARNLRCVFVYRHPSEVKASLFRRGISRFKPDWVENNNALIAGYENIEKSIIISYDSLVSGDEWVKDAFLDLGFKVNLGLINSKERSQKNSRVMATDEEEKLYNILCELEEEVKQEVK
ncbi:MAG: hypothetical protein ACOCVB_00505 [Bacillota bacterium]